MIIRRSRSPTRLMMARRACSIGRLGWRGLAWARSVPPALPAAAALAASRFRTAQARALFAGLGAHSMLSLRRPATASFGLVLAAAGHAYGGLFAHGGSHGAANPWPPFLRP